MLMPCPIAVSATPSANNNAEPTHRLSISRPLLTAKLSKPVKPHQCVAMLPAKICTQAEVSKITAIAVPLTTGPCHGTSLSKNSGDIEAYRPNTPNARNGSALVSTNANESEEAGQVSLGSTSRNCNAGLAGRLHRSGQLQAGQGVQANTAQNQGGDIGGHQGVRAHCPHDAAHQRDPNQSQKPAKIPSSWQHAAYALGERQLRQPQVALVVSMLEATPTITRPTPRLAMFHASMLMTVPSNASADPDLHEHGRKPARSGKRPKNSRLHRAPPM